MGIKFNADEIFEIAERIEKNGSRFYRAASEIVSNEGTKKSLLKLAEMENAHLKIFTIMRQDLTEKEKESAVKK